MRWEDERYVRVYTRDTVDWQSLSFDAQALLVLLLRKVDRAGILPLGKHGKRGVAIAIGHPREWPRLEPALEELLADGCMRLSGDGSSLLVPNFLEAQEARASDKARQTKVRELARDVAAAHSVTQRDIASQNVTGSHTPSHAVTSGHAVSHDVTPSLAVPSLAVPVSASQSAPPEASPQPATETLTLALGNLPAPEEALQPRPEDLQALWNAEAHATLPRWQGMSDKRRRAAAARLRERPLQVWRDVILRLSLSPFCRGEEGGGWRASPDWILQPDVADKVLEGKYDRPAAPTGDRPRLGPPAAAPRAFGDRPRI